jgi:cysteinyl-tRNA synthetase
VPGGEAAPAPLRIAGRSLPVVGRARVYVCGVTPYDVTHLGHAATFVWVDVAVRLLRRLGMETDVCRNVTDVDAHLFAAAARAGADYDSFAAVQQFWFESDMAALGVSRPTYEPRARNFIRPVVALAAGLLDREVAYVRAGSVYFRGGAVADRAGLDRAEALRLAAEFDDAPDDPAKDDPLDVAVWQRAEPGEPAWPSPWGPGRPGWHAECTAMALSTYGAAVDLHAGGVDLRFPHHAYEAAQAEALTGVTPFARAWMHVGTVRADGAKMAKSTGNLVLVRDLLGRHSAAAIRLLVLDRSWWAPWDYDPAGLWAAEDRLARLREAAGRRAEDSAAEEAVLAALRNDLDVPAAMEVALAEGGRAARTLVQVLGLS